MKEFLIRYGPPYLFGTFFLCLWFFKRPRQPDQDLPQQDPKTIPDDKVINPGDLDDRNGPSA